MVKSVRFKLLNKLRIDKKEYKLRIQTNLNGLDRSLLKASEGHQIHLDESKSKWHMDVVK
jgi:hypothetical protein